MTNAGAMLAQSFCASSATGTEIAKPQVRGSQAGALGRIRTDTVRSLRPLPLPLGYEGVSTTLAATTGATPRTSEEPGTNV